MAEIVNEDIQDFMLRVGKSVAKELTPISKEEAGVDYLLHIATDKLKSIPPSISRRSGYSEDNTVPRIHCSDSLLGCITGSANVADLATSTRVGDKDLLGNVYRGGFYIHQIPFEYLFKPTSKLVYDQSLSNELWLCTYNKDTALYPAKVVGEFYVHEVRTIPRTNKYPMEKVAIHIHVYNGYTVDLRSFIGINRPSRITLQSGYYRVDYWELSTTATNDRFELKYINANVYKEAKKLNADMLSFQEPPFTKW